MSKILKREVTLNISDALEKLIHEAKKADFEVVGKLDLSGFFNEKLGEKSPSSYIIQVIPPALAFETIAIEEKLKTSLPYSLVLEEEESGACKLTALRPDSYSELIKNPGSKEVLESITSSLEKVFKEM